MAMTAQRRIILEELRNSGNHPTADELFRAVRKRLPKVSLATVYRNLEVLASQGIIRKLAIPGARMRFDGVTQAHLHMRCVKCSRVMDAPLGAAQIPSQLPSELEGNVVLEYRLDILVECSTCRGKDSGQSHP
ncbi:MAG: Fur family transcriptional regulator [Thermodesulfobacteriota bacterium]